VLRDGLRRLPGEGDRRAASAARLDALLHELGVRTIAVHPRLHTRPVYEYCIFLDPGIFGDASPERLRAAPSAELGLPAYAAAAPPHGPPLFQPEPVPACGFSRRACFGAVAGYPVADAAFRRLAMIPHAAFLAEPDRMEEIARACDKVRRHAGRLSGA